MERENLMTSVGGKETFDPNIMTLFEGYAHEIVKSERMRKL